LSTGSKDNIQQFSDNNNFVFIKGDVNKKKDIANVFEKHSIDYVFHYAARVGVLRTIERPLEVLKDIAGIQHILGLSHKYKIKKVVFSSSSEVYGEPVEIPEQEDGHLNAKLPYAVVKLMGEQYMKSYYDTYGLKTCSLRFFNTYGPRQESSSYGFVTGVFIRQALEGNSLTIFGDGTQTRDFVFIKDNINASIIALLNDNTNGESINLGTGRPITILDLTEHIIAIVKSKKLKVEFKSLRTLGEIKHRFPDVTKMKKLLKYTPQYSLEEGLQETFNWYKENKKQHSTNKS
jgi:UDP-glucose 4-epimerase